MRKNVFRKMAKTEPEDNRDDNREGNDDNREGNRDNQALVLDAISKNQHQTIRLLAVDLPISKATVERVLKVLLKSRRIRRVSGIRGHWDVLLGQWRQSEAQLPLETGALPLQREGTGK